NTAGDAGDGTNNEACTEHTNNNDEDVISDFTDTADQGNPLADLDGGETKCGCCPEQGGDNGEDIDEFSSEAFGLGFTEQGLEDRRNQGWATAAERCIGKGPTDECVHAPDVQTPVVACLRYALVDRFPVDFSLATGRFLQAIDGFLLICQGVWRRIHEVGQWFGRTVEKQSNAQPGTEHHGDPGKPRELWFLIVFAQFDFAVFTKGDIEHHEQPNTHGEVEQPAHIFHRPGKGDAGHRCHGLWTNQPPQYKRNDNRTGHGKDCFIDAEIALFVVNSHTG